MLILLVGCNQPAQDGGSSWDLGAIFASADQKSEGEKWTILCLEMWDKDHVRNVDVLAAAMRRVDGLNVAKIQTSHDAAVSRIYYGTYVRKLDASRQREGFGPEALRDLQFIRSLAAGQNLPFAAARLVPVPTPDVGNPEWHIRRCPGAYTLQIGVFYNTPTFSQRKEAAAQWTEQLRAEGIEAYYHHGEVRSSVTVGHFGPEDILHEPSGPDRSTSGARTRYSERVEALRRQESFRYNLENGYKMKRVLRTADGPREVYQESFLIPVPRS